MEKKFADFHKDKFVDQMVGKAWVVCTIPTEKERGGIVSSTFPPSRISTFSHAAVGGRRRERNRYEVKEEEEKRRSRDAKSFQNEKMARFGPKKVAIK